MIPSGNHFKLVKILSNATSCLALSAMAMALAPVPLMAADIIYDGTDTSLLVKDKSGNNSPFNSLYPENNPSQNSLTVDGGVQGVQTEWPANATGGTAPYVIYGGVSIKTDTSNTNGNNGEDIKQSNVVVKDVQFDWSNAINKAPDGSSSGGIGGMGGATIIGALSVGASGSISYTGDTAGYGGTGGAIANNTVTIENVTLRGSAAGDGGYSDSNAYRGSGIGGLGGGSVLGGLTVGGAGGWSSGATNNASGGQAGNIAGNTISLKNTNLYGGKGSKGGSHDGGSVGGMGGASVGGGVSIGGAGGTGYSGEGNNGFGGNGGAISDNHIILTSVTLDGADGGNGGESIVETGGGGVAGMGGGSVYGGISIGGAGGYGGNSGQKNGDGGSGGDVHNNELTLTHVTISGGAGGNGGAGKTQNGGATAGIGGGVIAGGLTIGGAGGTGYQSSNKNGNGGHGGLISANRITLTDVTINGGVGGAGGSGISGGIGGMGGASVVGGLSIGGSGGNGNFKTDNDNPDSSGGIGGNGGTVDGNIISADHITLNGAKGGNGGYGGGVGGMGGGSVYGGISIGGVGGLSYSAGYHNSRGGDSGNVTNNQIKLVDSTLYGSDGGNGGAARLNGTFDRDALPQDERENTTMGGSGVGGMGGGSVIGGLSIGGAGGFGATKGEKNGDGGLGGTVSQNTITLERVELHGGMSGKAGSTNNAGNETSSVHGLSGGSIYGGVSIGGAGGIGYNGSASDGNGGSASAVHDNHIFLTDVTLYGSSGEQHYAGVYGGVSIGGTGGFGSAGINEIKKTGTGGASGDVNANTISIAGKSFIWGNVYGGLSQGGQAGKYYDLDANTTVTSNFGLGGNATNNVVTLSGDKIIIGERDNNGEITKYGEIWGGRSINGDGKDNEAANVFSGNTLNLVGYRGKVSGIYNFENYNWTLPKDIKNGNTLITIAEGGTAVDLTNTKHTIANMDPDGNRLQSGDSITMIDKTKGVLAASDPYTIKQGQFIVYNATLQQKAAGADTALVLNIAGKTDDTPNNDHGGNNNDTGGGNCGDHTGCDNGGSNSGGDTGGENTGGGNTGDNSGDHTNGGTGGSNSGGNNGSGNNGSGSTTGGGNNQSAAMLNPQSKSYAEGRAANLGFVAQGSDVIANSVDAISGMAAQQQAHFTRPIYVPFIITNGSSGRYQTGSHVSIDGFNMVAGIAAGFDLANGHKVTTGAFFEYGRGTYDTYNSFARFASVHGDGDSDYKGGGILGRIEFAGTGIGRVKDLKADQTDGLYVDGSLRFGQSSSKFDVGRNLGIKGQIVDYRGSYDSDVNYFGGHIAGGYVFNFDEQRSFDVYGRYLWTHMESETVSIGNEKLHFDSSTSSRIELGGRYSYAYSDWLKPYIGAAYDYEFDGDIAAQAYEFYLDKPSLEGSTGIFEAGIKLNPARNNKALSVNIDGQGYVGARQGGGGGIKLKYEF